MKAFKKKWVSSSSSLLVKKMFFCEGFLLILTQEARVYNTIEGREGIRREITIEVRKNRSKFLTNSSGHRGRHTKDAVTTPWSLLYYFRSRDDCRQIKKPRRVVLWCYSLFLLHQLCQLFFYSLLGFHCVCCQDSIVNLNITNSCLM